MAATNVAFPLSILVTALALLLAGLYMLLTFTPPGWGPFVNPLG